MEFNGIWVVDFGGQYNQLIARRVREAHVYCEIVAYENVSKRLAAGECPKGVIFTGGPNSVYETGAPTLPETFFSGEFPILGICYGAQLMAHVLGGKVVSPDYKEYGRVAVTKGSTVIPAETAGVTSADSLLLKDVASDEMCWMSHTDYIEQVPDGFKVTSYTANCPTASMEDSNRGFYAVQYHPEVHHTPFGQTVLKNFLYEVCHCEPNWTMANFAKEKIKEIRETVGDRKVMCALSGGVDSSVAAVLVHEAIGDNLTCIFVDHGLLRKGEGDQVMQVYGEEFHMKIKRVNVSDRFMAKLDGVSDPERKRKIIGAEFIAVFDEESKALFEEEGQIDFLLQGTIYPDVVESGGGGGKAAVIKSHHNVGGLPDDMALELLEPLRNLFKDEVRAVGEELGIAPELVWRQPFPGPGLAIRCLGAVSEEKLEIIRESDAILREEIDAYNVRLFKETGVRNSENSVWQYFTVLPDIRSVGVMGDARTYDYAVGVRAVTSTDGMTSDWARIPYDVLETISNRIVNEVNGVNRILYDLTSKPPGTIEWE
ncbi:MAG: glutamine-hydrolyzing GMP synthase [Clostridiales Family XIII bacterium]|jgi:GMP synthase (glutamine-hydrolysing)|nr:glutamine-hydrolyzing GMP synthase [Clostridiales Family XIII bacterium]